MRYLNDKNKQKEYEKKLDFPSIFSQPEKLAVRLAAFEPGEILYQAAVRPQFLYFIAEGKIQIYAISPDGQQFTTTFEEAPAFLGDLEFIENSVSVNHVEAVTNLTCLLLPMEKCRETLKNDFLFHKFLCHSLAQKLIGTGESRQGIRLPFKQRLASYLLVLWQSGKGFPNLQEACAMLGCSYRHLLRILKELCREGALAVTKKGHYQITDINLLRQAAGL